MSIVPYISHVIINGHVVMENSTVSGRIVNICGTAEPGKKVKIFDGATVLKEVTSSASAYWATDIETQEKNYVLKAQGQYANNPESNTFSFTASHLGP